MDLEDLNYDDEGEEESTDEEENLDELDPIAAERKRRLKAQDRLRRTAGTREATCIRSAEATSIVSGHVEDGPRRMKLIVQVGHT
jgi:hypothetical protein